MKVERTAVGSARKPLVVVCGWCPDAREKTLAAQQAGNDVSHGMCPACSAKLLEALNKE